MKTNQDSELKIFDCCIFGFGIQRSFVKSWLAHPFAFKSLKTNYKNEKDMGLEPEEGQELFFQKI
jgi:hypothetical protein